MVAEQQWGPNAIQVFSIMAVGISEIGSQATELDLQKEASNNHDPPDPHTHTHMDVLTMAPRLT